MCLLNCPPHLKNVTTLSCEIQKVIFNIKASRAFTTAIGKFLEREIGFIFYQTLFNMAAMNLQTYLVHAAVETKKCDICLHVHSRCQ